MKGIVVSLGARGYTPPCGLLEKEPEAEKGGHRGSRRRRAGTRWITGLVVRGHAPAAVAAPGAEELDYHTR